jgi:hypothetical protein
VQLKLAILTVLATRPDGRATLDELKSEVEALAAKEDQPGDLSSGLDDIDIFQSGLVMREDGGLRITDAGRSALNALKGPRKSALDLPPMPPSHSLNLTDDLVGTEERRKIFDLDPRRLGLPAGKAKQEPMKVATLDDTVDDRVVERPGIKQVLGEAADEHADPLASDKIAQTDAIELTAPPPHDSPASLQPSFGAKQDTDRWPFGWLAGSFAAAATKAQSLAGLWRSHIVHDTSSPKTHRVTGSAVGAMLAFLSLATVFACAAAALALVQLKSSKTEIATLHRDLGSLKERFAKLEQAAEKNKAGVEPSTDQGALNLSREEIQLIRDFIKPSPAGSTPAPAINVGDPVGVATIPLPSPLMEKVPKLLGGRFTTHNGSIIILRRDSRHADVVLPPS